MPGVIISNNTADSRVSVDDGAMRARLHNEFEVAVAAGDAYSWGALTYDFTAKDTILLVENNSTTQDLYIHQILITCDTASQFIVHAASGITPTSATTPVGVNLNRNYASRVAVATAKTNDTGNTAADGYTYRLYVGRIAADGQNILEVNGAVILPEDHAIGVDLTANGAAANVTIIGYFK